MDQAFYVVIGVLILFTVIGLVGIFIEPPLREKEK